MGIRIRIDPRKLEQRILVPFLSAVADAKVDQLKGLARQNFKNRTGTLFRTIRKVGTSTVAIGNRRASYWQYLKNFRRGEGEDWVDDVLEKGNDNALRKAAQRTRR